MVVVDKKVLRRIDQLPVAFEDIMRRAAVEAVREPIRLMEHFPL